MKRLKKIDKNKLQSDYSDCSTFNNMIPVPGLMIPFENDESDWDSIRQWEFKSPPWTDMNMFWGSNNMKRLVKKAKLNKVAYNGMILDSMITPSGIMFVLEARIINNNKVMYQIYQDPDGYNISSLYDGDNLYTALRIYKDLLLAFKTIKDVEDFDKKQNIIMGKIDKLIFN